MAQPLTTLIGTGPKQLLPPVNQKRHCFVAAGAAACQQGMLQRGSCTSKGRGLVSEGMGTLW